MVVTMVKKQSTKMGDKGQDKTTGLYKIAAKIMKKVKTGSSYKTQLYQAQYPNKLSLNAVLMNVFKWEKVIDVLIEKTNILEKENNMDPELVYVLITELMWSKFGLKGNAKNILAIKKYKNEFLELMKGDELVKLSTSMPTKVSKPRFFRVNTLVTTLEDVLKKLSEQKFNKLKTPKTYAEFLELIKSDKFKGNTFVQDVHIKELLVFNSKVKFYNLEEYNNGSLIIQDKASCLAAHLLNPEPESTVLDMCAAPGMKTSHLAAIMQNKGKLYAVDRCKDRFNTLQNMLKKYGVNNAETFNMDALTFPYFDDVKYILVDPSCSGSGIVDRVRNDSSGQNEHLQIRLKKLANVHAQLLNHALKSYPKLERLVYSTCSANHEENEAVVDEALSVNGKFKLLDATKIVKGWVNKGAPGYDCSEMCLNAVPNVDCTNGFFIAIFVRRDFEDNEINDEEVSEDINENPSEVTDQEDSKEIDEVTKECEPRIKTDKIKPKIKKQKTKKSKILDNTEEVLEDLNKNSSEIMNQEVSEIIDEEFAKVSEPKIKIDKLASKNKIINNKKRKIIDEEVSKVCEPTIEANENMHKTKKQKTKMLKILENTQILEDLNKNPSELMNPEVSEDIDEECTKVSEPKIKTDKHTPKKKINNNKKRKITDEEVAKVCEPTIEANENVNKTKNNKPLKSEVSIKNSEPVKKSKNVKRRERRLKLEQANGKPPKIKKSKKNKNEST